MIVGDQHVERVLITAEMIETFASATGDTNPVHMNDEAAQERGFPGRIAHGMLLGAVISRIIGTVFPGPGSIYLGQHLRFTAPVCPGDEVEIRLFCYDIHKSKTIAHMSTSVLVAGKSVIEGEAVVKLPKET